jgi:Icc-related predicted phosphoesterase
MKSENELREKYAEIPKDTDILITHGPALGILDCLDDKVTLGSGALLNRLEEVNPKVSICGHIHTGHGKSVHKYTRCYNVSLLNEDYKLAFTPTIIKV